MTPPTRLMERLREDFEDRHAWLRRIAPLVKELNTQSKGDRDER